MFADDISLIRVLVERHGPIPTPVVDVGGLENPCIADYQWTIDAMSSLRYAPVDARSFERVMEAQMVRYRNIARPLSFVDSHYVIENPETGGLPIEQLPSRYPKMIGTAILLSVLEHVADPFQAIRCLWHAMQPGGLVMVSVPWEFPHHPSPEDNWRFSPSGLRHVFTTEPDAWVILECDWRLDIRSDAGVLDVQTGRPQAIKSCYLAARAK